MTHFLTWQQRITPLSGNKDKLVLGGKYLQIMHPKTKINKNMDLGLIEGQKSKVSNGCAIS